MSHPSAPGSTQDPDSRPVAGSPAPEAGAATDGGGADLPLLFDAVLTPHRSLSPRGFTMLIVGFGLVSFIAGIGFVTLGAWPVFGFLGLNVALLYLAFRLNYRAARHYETVQLNERALRVSRGGPKGIRDSITFQPYWVRVDIDDPPEHESQLRLRSHGLSVVIGSFLTPEERLDLARALRAELARLRQPVFNSR